MGLTFDQPAEDPCVSAFSAARKELAQALELLISHVERLEGVEESARRYREEFTAAKDHLDRLLFGVSAGMRQLAEDPSAADHAALDEDLRDGQEATARLREFVPAYQAMEREIAALKYEEQLASGRVTAARQLAEIVKAVLELEELKREAARLRSSPAVAADTDA